MCLARGASETADGPFGSTLLGTSYKAWSPATRPPVSYHSVWTSDHGQPRAEIHSDLTSESFAQLIAAMCAHSPPPHCTPATPSTPQKELGDSGEGGQNHERKVSCFWIHSNAVFAVLTWLFIHRGEEKIDDGLGLWSQTGPQRLAVLVSSTEGKC